MYTLKSIVFAALIVLSITVHADEPFVDVNQGDTQVIAVARFAADAIGRGDFYQVLSAQTQNVLSPKQEITSINYRVNIQVVDAHRLYHNYVVVVNVPTDDSPWQVEYFLPEDD